MRTLGGGLDLFLFLCIFGCGSLTSNTTDVTSLTNSSTSLLDDVKKRNWPICETKKGVHTYCQFGCCGGGKKCHSSGNKKKRCRGKKRKECKRKKKSQSCTKRYKKCCESPWEETKRIILITVSIAGCVIVLTLIGVIHEKKDRIKERLMKIIETMRKHCISEVQKTEETKKTPTDENSTRITNISLPAIRPNIVTPALPQEDTESNDLKPPSYYEVISQPPGYYEVVDLQYDKRWAYRIDVETEQEQNMQLAGNIEKNAKEDSQGQVNRG